MPNIYKEILARHRNSLAGELKVLYCRSQALGIRKPYFVYEPPGLDAATNIPVVYLFRGHEREWANFREDQSRQRTTAVEDVDGMIAAGALPPMLLVMPGLNSANNIYPSLGIDMAGSWPSKTRGLGRGLFWRYLTKELLPRIDATFPAAQNGWRAMVGFSLGGYTVSLLGAFLPGYFRYAGIYDGLFMWPAHQDPRVNRRPGSDKIWCRAEIFDAALGKPRDARSMWQWNPTEFIRSASKWSLAELRKTSYWIASAAEDGAFGNRDRAAFYIQLLKQKSIPVRNVPPVLAPDAAHTWHWTDRFLIRFLRAIHEKKMG